MSVGLTTKPWTHPFKTYFCLNWSQCVPPTAHINFNPLHKMHNINQNVRRWNGSWDNSWVFCQTKMSLSCLCKFSEERPIKPKITSHSLTQIDSFRCFPPLKILTPWYWLKAYNYVPSRNRIRELRCNEPQTVVAWVTPSRLYLIGVVLRQYTP